jgi:thymidylate synthase (FAD)
MNRVRPAVFLAAWTRFDTLGAAERTGWTAGIDVDPASGQAAAEFAGRACYQSWTKPNPATATNYGYLGHILDVGHLSVLEHGQATFYLTGVSRSFTHELVRHRHFSYSQLSQRYVAGEDTAMVEPDIIAADPELHELFTEATDAAVAAYTRITARLAEKLEAAAEASPHRPRVVPDGSYRPGAVVRAAAEACAACGQTWPCQSAPSKTSVRKQARQAARAVLPNAAETRIVVTGNYRAWRHFLDLRATEHADVEIREVAILVLRELQRHAPNVFGDYVITALPDGTEVAASPHSERS